MIRPRLSKIASGTRLTADLINYIINRIEYAADLLRQYKLIAGTEMYVEPHYDGTRVSYLKPVGSGAGSRPPPSDRDTIELQPGIVYSVSADQVNINGKITTFTFSPIAYQQGILLYGGTWEWKDLYDGKWKAWLDNGYISGATLAVIGGFRPSNWGYDYRGTPYWQGGTIQIYGT